MLRKIIVSIIIVFAFQNISAQKVYSVQYENQAGWQNKSKQYLMY